MNQAQEALKQIEIHTAECSVLREAISERLTRIENRLDAGGARFNRVERLIYANSVAIVAALSAMEYVK